jgi:NADP-dependent 3-hydroxy acid dehydrogenase YdfG
MSLEGRSALITGASRGIGLSIARAFVAAGARTFLLARSAGALETAANALGSLALALPYDLSRSDQIERAVARVTEETGGAPDILVQNAGLFVLGAVGKLQPETFAVTLDVNLVAPYRLAHALVPKMRERGSGDVVTIGSIADRQVFPENAAYAASKYGARAVHEVLREELRGTGVRASLVSPGPVDTAMWDDIDPDSRDGFTPRARMLRPEAVADAVLWVVTRPPDVDIEELRLGRS